MQAKTIKLTEKQIEALIWAADLTAASYDGWTKAEMGSETVRDLAVLLRASQALEKAAN